MALRNGIQSKRSSLFVLVTLAIWQVRLTWRLLLICGAGILVATTLICIVPLYSQVALSAGLQATLDAASTNSSVNVSGTLDGTSDPNAINTLTRQVDQTIVNDIGGDALDPRLSQFVIHVGPTSLLLPGAKSPARLPYFQLVGQEQRQLAAHVHLLAGRLPRAASDVIEIDLLPSVAHCLFLSLSTSSQSANPTCFSVNVGDEITIASPWRKAGTASGALQAGAFTTTLHVVGLFTPLNAADPFWHGDGFANTSTVVNDISYSLVTGLTSDEAFASALHAAVQEEGGDVFFLNAFPSSTLLTWYNSLDVAHLHITNITSLAGGLSNITGDIGNIAGEGRSRSIYAQLSASSPTDLLEAFSGQVIEAQVPVNLLLLMVMGMVILFISMVTELLVERQTDAIALLRSRGASRHQIFGSFATQMLALGLLALVSGPLLAIPLAVLLAQHLFSSLEPGAAALITAQPLATAWTIRWYVLFGVGLALLGTLGTLYQTTSFDVLALRREASRPRRAPFWQRFYFDGLLAVLALACYAYAFYSFTTGTLDALTGTQIIAPLMLGASALLLLAGLLLLLRILPHLMRFLGKLAARRSGAASMLALSQIARAPRQVARSILLLTLTTAFMIFSLVFSASQAQHIVDVVNYQVGADFSAQLPVTVHPDQPTPALSAASLATGTASFRAIPGVLSATLGIMEPAQLGDTSLLIKAVDAETFARTALWTTQDSEQPLSSLMDKLMTDRRLAQSEQVIPAIVDSETWNALHLSLGQRFTLGLSAIGSTGTHLPFLAIAEVEHIPTMISVEGGSLSSQGLLVDDQSFSLLFTKITNQPPSINYVWLRARADPSALSSVRAGLAQRVPSTGSLEVSDRLALIAALQHDPLTLNLVGILAIGALTPLILALLGSLLLSWVSVRSRLLSFAVLRALGSSPAQLFGVLSWEQGIVYALMLILGMLAGVGLSALVLPWLILTSTALPSGSGNVVGSLSFQRDLPVLQIVIPPFLLLALGLLIVIYMLTLGLMAQMVSRPSLSQILRLNAD